MPARLAVYFFPLDMVSLSSVRFGAVVGSAGDGDPHRPGGTGDLLLGRLDVGGVEVGEFDGGDLGDLGIGDRSDGLAAGGGGALVEAGGRETVATVTDAQIT